ncbi:MAG: hypothetical protein AAF242_10225 [Bacteroidota bacterium]
MMKSIRFLALVVTLALTLPTLSMANNAPGKLQFRTKVEGKKVKVHLANLQKMATTVSLESLDGEKRFYRGAIKDHNGYSSQLHLDKLPNGRYALTVDNNGKSYSKVIKVDGDQIWVSK